MAALWNRAGRNIFAVVSFFLFFSRLISAAADWMSTILLHMVWPQWEFKMQVCNVLRAACWKCRPQKLPKIPHLGTTLSGNIFATKARIDNRKKIVKQQCLPHMLSQYGELQPTSFCMVALCNRRGALYFCPVVSIYLSFFPRLMLMTHDPETGARNRRQKTGVGF